MPSSWSTTTRTRCATCATRWRRAGYAPAVTGDPDEILALVEAKRPRLALLDLALPSTDGIVLMQTLPALAGLPVIFVFAYGREETVARALEAGRGRLRREALLAGRAGGAGARGATQGDRTPASQSASALRSRAKTPFVQRRQ